MSGEIALDTSVAVRFLNGDTAIISRVHKKTYEVTAGGSGSGYFVTADGYIGTNAHVTQLYQNKKQCMKELFESFVMQIAQDYKKLSVW